MHAVEFDSPTRDTSVTDKTYNLLVLCTGNSARSLMAEALFNTLGNGRFHAYSAGSHPTGKINPLAVEQVRLTGYPLENLRSKSWDEFARAGAAPLDFVITVCDKAAGEVCPVWPGQPITAHWGFEDPAAATGTDEEKRRIFEKVFRYIRNRVQLFLSLPIESLDQFAIKRKMDEIGLIKDEKA